MVRLLSVILCSALACGPAIATVPSGYVVKVDGKRVYLDYGADSGIQAGQEFSVFFEGEELKHPVTGESLGMMEKNVGKGVVESVLEKYSIGLLGSIEGSVAAGAKFRLGPPPPPPSLASPAPPAEDLSSPAALRRPYYRSPLIDMDAVDIALGDVDGNGTLEILLADPNQVRIYPDVRTGKRWTPTCTFKDESTGLRFLSIEAFDVDKDGKAEIFATYFSAFFKRVETYVLKCDGDKLKVQQTLPWMVRSFQRPDGTWALGMQQLQADKSFPLSGIFEVASRDGKIEPSETRVKHKRLEFIYGFNFAQRENPAGDEQEPDPFLIFYNDVGRLRTQFKRGSWSSREKYGQTAERVKWYENHLKFRSRFIVEHSPKGITGLYTLKSIAGMFKLAAPFGLFKNSELHHLRWNGMSLEPNWKAELTGYAAGMAQDAPGANGTLFVIVRGVEKNASVWYFRK